MDGLADDEVETVAIGPDSAFWFGTKEGVSRYDPANNTWRSFTYWADGLADDWVRAVVIGPDGALWFGTRGGVSRYDPINDIWQSYTHADGSMPHGVNAVVVGLDDALWFGTAGGLSRYDLVNDTWQSYTPADNLACDMVDDMAVGLDGVLWFVPGGLELDGGCRGVSRFNPASGRWQTLTQADGLANDRFIYAVAVGSDGAIWVGAGHSMFISGGGVNRYDPISGTWRFFNMTDDVADDFVRALEVSPDGIVWIGTSKSVIRFERSDR